MNVIEIEESIDDILSQGFKPADFIFDFIEAYGGPILRDPAHLVISGNFWQNLPSSTINSEKRSGPCRTKF